MITEVGPKPDTSLPHLSKSDRYMATATEALARWTHARKYGAPSQEVRRLEQEYLLAHQEYIEVRMSEVVE